MLYNNNLEVKKICDEEGIEHNIVMECEIRGRKFIITIDKKIFEKDENENYKECTKNDEETKFLVKYLEEPKSLDVEL